MKLSIYFRNSGVAVVLKDIDERSAANIRREIGSSLSGHAYFTHKGEEYSVNRKHVAFIQVTASEPTTPS